MAAFSTYSFELLYVPIYVLFEKSSFHIFRHLQKIPQINFIEQKQNRMDQNIAQGADSSVESQKVILVSYKTWVSEVVGILYFALDRLQNFFSSIFYSHSTSEH